jgi:hypothetical protein
MLVPFLLAVCIYGLGWGYRLYEEQALARRTAFLHMVPDVRRELAAASGVLDELAGNSVDRSRATADLSVRINDSAAASGFAVEPLEAGSAGASQKGGATSIDVTVKGRGNLNEVVSFLNGVLGGGRLITVESCTLSVGRLRPVPQYEVELVFRYHAIAG